MWKNQTLIVMLFHALRASFSAHTPEILSCFITCVDPTAVGWWVADGEDISAARDPGAVSRRCRISSAEVVSPQTQHTGVQDESRLDLIVVYPKVTCFKPEKTCSVRLFFFLATHIHTHTHTHTQPPSGHVHFKISPASRFIGRSDDHTARL